MKKATPSPTSLRLSARCLWFRPEKVFSHLAANGMTLKPVYSNDAVLSWAVVRRATSEKAVEPEHFDEVGWLFEAEYACI